MNNKSKEKCVATAQPCVAGKQPVGMFLLTSNKSFVGFAGFVMKKKNKQITIK